MSRSPRLVQLSAESHRKDDSGKGRGVPGGDFSTWLQRTEAALQSGKEGTDVPCGSCRGCCRSSMFIHIGPDEVETIGKIPKKLLFPAPGLPKGHVLMGYGDQGQCPMLVDGECSIYESRPQTCKDYDCRIFAATGIGVDESSQPEIARRVGAWRFRYKGDGRALQAALRRTVSFLQRNKDKFPHGTLPNQPGPLGSMALRFYRLFTAAVQPSDAALVRRITATLSRRNARVERAGKRPANGTG